MPHRLVLLLTALSLAACGPFSTKPSPAIIIGEPSFAVDSFADWKAHADVVAVVSVIDQRTKREPHGTTSFTQIARWVDLRIDRVLWGHRRSDERHVEVQNWGWEVRDGVRHPEVPQYGVRLEVGRRYLVALWLGDGPGPIGEAGAVPLCGSRLCVDVRQAGWLKQVDGLSVDAFARRFERIASDRHRTRPGG